MHVMMYDDINDNQHLYRPIIQYFQVQYNLCQLKKRADLKKIQEEDMSQLGN